ncbi:transcriptional regulator, AraC family [Thiorhodococcus drewsii AZ1]|uniref:Transcriptional regulator, AraC family n=1 Tax=Thiorhodococcus drewsii AZ1 TaxID=765913 RepID=G2E3V4_9GAMM|nr:AraC family transcriptional regulator [Thiorhodococcus drewsii]EGV30046.1 transcriptional regulator, AraC family [Thiorhodococcus drewsii AZ1]
MESTTEGVEADRRPCAHPVHDQIPLNWTLPGGRCISCWNTHLDTDLALSGRCEPAFRIGIQLEGRSHMRLQGGPSLALSPGMAVVMSTQQTVTGHDDLVGAQSMQLVEFSIPANALPHFCDPARLQHPPNLVEDCSLPAQGAFMAGIVASNDLMRVGRDILGGGRIDVALQPLYLGAKIDEALALVLSDLLAADAWNGTSAARDRRPLLDARRLLDEQYEQDWTVPRLAERVGMSEKRLQSGFKSLFGATVRTYLIRTRIEAASRLLARGECVTETAYAVGFSSLSHFSKIYKECMGRAPRDWALHAAARPNAQDRA